MRFHLNISRNLTHFAVPPNVLCATFVTLISSLATLGPSHFTWFEQKSKTIQHPCLNNNNPCVKTSFFVNKKENLPALLHPYFLSLLLQLLGSPFEQHWALHTATAVRKKVRMINHQRNSWIAKTCINILLFWKVWIGFLSKYHLIKETYIKWFSMKTKAIEWNGLVIYISNISLGIQLPRNEIATLDYLPVPLFSPVLQVL